MQNKIVRGLIGLLFVMIFTTIPTLETAAVSNCLVEELEYDTVTCDHFFTDAFVIGIIQEKRAEQFGITYVNATMVYTTEFHRFYTGELEITGFRGVLTASFICGFYNDGW